MADWVHPLGRRGQYGDGAHASLLIDRLLAGGAGTGVAERSACPRGSECHAKSEEMVLGLRPEDFLVLSRAAGVELDPSWDDGSVRAQGRSTIHL